MNERPPASREPGCAEIERELGAAETRSRSRAAPPPALDLNALRTHLHRCAACRARLAGRLAALEAFAALRHREVPSGALAGLYDSVRERAPLVPPGGGMSPAFLDAPRSLHLWRGAALAATVALALGAGVVLTRGETPEDGPAAGVRPLHDPRHRLLEAMEGDPAWGGPRLRVRPVFRLDRRGDGGFYDRGGAHPVDLEHELEPEAGWK